MNTKWAAQLVRIFNRAYQTRMDGQEKTNPYEDGTGNLQIQRRRYWCLGWKKAEEDLKEIADELTH